MEKIKTMKTKTNNKISNTDNVNLKIRNTYYFKWENRLVKVVFSDSVNAPTVENALAKIAIKRIG